MSVALRNTIIVALRMYINTYIHMCMYVCVYVGKHKSMHMYVYMHTSYVSVGMNGHTNLVYWTPHD